METGSENDFRFWMHQFILTQTRDTAPQPQRAHA